MKKISAIVTALFLCTNILTGCQKTPKEVLVVPKEQNGNFYAENSSDLMQTLGEKLDIEDTYSASFTSPDQKTTYTADQVKVEYPDVTSISVYEVSLQKLDQDFVNQITKGLFGDAPIYSEQDYRTRTKSEIIEELEYMKECVARGELDPYNYGRFEIYDYIDELEDEYSNAPKEYTHRTAEEKDWEALYEEGEDNGEFRGYAIVNEDNTYFYDIVDWDRRGSEEGKKILAMRDRSQGYEMTDEYTWESCSTKRLADPEDDWYIGSNYTNRYEIKEDEIEKFEENVGISQEDALAKADALVERLGIGDMELNYANPAVLSFGMSQDSIYDFAYEFHYTRTIDGVPTLYTNLTTFYQGIGTTHYVYEPEQLTVIVSEDGIEQVEIQNIYELGEVRQKNPTLMSYEEVVKKFENMILVQYTSNSMRESYKQEVVVEEISLSYMRIEEAETGDYLLVPVWDFLGYNWDNNADIGSVGTDGVTYSICAQIWIPRALITINAIDGTIIDRDKGY